MGTSNIEVSELVDNNEEEKDDNLLPPVNVIIDQVNKVKVTKEELIVLKKEYEQEYAINPPKEIKRLPTFFDIMSEEEKELS